MLGNLRLQAEVIGARQPTPIMESEAPRYKPYDSLKSIITGAARNPRVLTAT